MSRKPAANYEFFGSRIPARMAGALDAWIDQGWLPAGFLQAVLRNDLLGAFERADEENKRNLQAYLGYLHNEAPGPCWGSPEKVAAWAESFRAAREREAQRNADRIDGCDRDNTGESPDY